MNSEKRNEELEINLVEIFGLLLNKIVIILLSAVLGLVIAFAYTKLLITPQYQSSTEIYVTNSSANNNTTEEGIKVTDLQSSTYLTKDYMILAKSRPVMNSVIEKLKLDMSANDLEAKTSVTTYTDTRIIKIAVSDSDPLEAKKLTDAVTTEAIAHIENIIGVDSVKLSNGEANIPANPISPNTKLNSIIGFLIGMFIAIVVVIVKYILDDSIKTQDDIEKYLGLSVLGLIPELEGMDTSKKKKKKKKR